MISTSYTCLDDLDEELGKALRVFKDRIVIDNTSIMQGELIDRLASTAIDGTGEVKEFANWIIWEASQVFGCGAASLGTFYNAMRNKHVRDLSVPCVDLENISYREICIIFDVARSLEMGVLSFEAGCGEAGTIGRQPNEYASQVLAAAVKTGWNMPVFLYWSQAVNKGPDLSKEAIESGFFNFDVIPESSRDMMKSLKIATQIAVDSEQCLEDYKSPLGKMYPPLPVDFGRIESRGFRTILSIEGAPVASEDEIRRRCVMAFERLGNRRTVDILRRHVIQMPNHRSGPQSVFHLLTP